MEMSSILPKMTLLMVHALMQRTSPEHEASTAQGCEVPTYLHDLCTWPTHLCVVHLACRRVPRDRARSGGSDDYQMTIVRGDNLNTPELGRPHKSRLRELVTAPV